MGTEENKAVVRRFLEDVASGRDVSVAEEVCAPNYVNLAFPGVDIAGLKAMTTAIHAAVGEARSGPLELVAEGDAVFAQFDYSIGGRPPHAYSPAPAEAHTNHRHEAHQLTLNPDSTFPLRLARRPEPPRLAHNNSAKCRLSSAPGRRARL